MIREDRELLAELARLNGDMASLGLRIMEGSASVIEQQRYAQRLIAAGERLHRRATGMNRSVIDGEVLADKVITFPLPILELDWKPRPRCTRCGTGCSVNSLSSGWKDSAVMSKLNPRWSKNSRYDSWQWSRCCCGGMR
jgi:hypothetical protein